jgi:hypothetical protein
MSHAKTAGLIAGFLGAFGLGLVVGPMIMDQRSDRPAVSVSQPVPAPEAAAAPAPARSARTARPAPPGFAANRPIVIEQPAAHPELHQRLKPVLNRGTNMNKAADGFRNAEEFAMVAHASRNTEVPFALLKHRVLDQRMSLDEAIRASKPEIDVAGAVREARAEALADVKAVES